MALTCDALTREDLDNVRCGDPACAAEHLTLTVDTPCHPGIGLDVSYDKRTGRMTAACHFCDRVIAVYAVARSELVQ